MKRLSARWLALSVVLAACGAPAGTRTRLPRAELAPSPDRFPDSQPVEPHVEEPHVEASRAEGSTDDPPAVIHTEEVPATLGGGLVATGATPHRMVLFTFDDGPHPTHTPALLDVLDAAHVRAVFFVVPGRIARGGARADEEAALVRQIRARGHIVGSHGLNHVHLHRLEGETLAHEVIGAEETLSAVLGERPWLFRPPGGARSSSSDALLAERGYTQMLWSVVSGDFLTTDPEEVLATFRRSLRGRERRGVPGGIVLLHDTHPWTITAVPRLLAHLEARNCELLAAGEELYDPSPDPAWFIAPRGVSDGPETLAPMLSPPREVFAARQSALRAEAEARCTATGS